MGANFSTKINGFEIFRTGSVAGAYLKDYIFETGGAMYFSSRFESRAQGEVIVPENLEIQDENPHPDPLSQSGRGKFTDFFD